MDFEKYFNEVFREGKNPPLFHDWLFDQMFHGKQLPPELTNKIKQAIYRTLTTAFWTSDFTKLAYGREVTSRVVVPAGFYQGKRISDLGGSKDEWKLLIQLKKTTRDDNIRQACIYKMNELKIQKDMAKDHANKRSKNRKRY